MGRVEVRGLRGVDGRPAADGDERVESALGREGDRLAERDVGRLYTDPIEERMGDAVVPEALEDGLHRLQLRETGVAEDHHLLDPHLRQVHPDLAGDASPEADAGGCHLERVLERHETSAGRPCPSWAADSTPLHRAPTVFAGAPALSVPQQTTGCRSGLLESPDPCYLEARLPPSRDGGAFVMPEKRTVKKARKDLREGKSPTTAAGEFVHEEMDHIRHGKHGARSTKQAIAIGLSKARRAGVPLKPPGKGRTSRRTRQSAKRAYEVGQGKRKPRSPSRRRSLAASRALRREPHRAASRKALSRQAHRSARRGRRSRSRR